MYDLNYNLLWFEDDDRFIESKAESFKDTLDDLGIGFHYELHKKGEDLDDIIKTKSDLKRWDLILVDYNLEQDCIKGDELINNIKKISPYCELLFYSDTPNFIENLKNNSLLEGVYFCRGRANLDEKVNGLIDLSLKRTQNVTYQRGIIIAYTIELAQIIDDIVVNMLKLDDKISDFYLNDILSQEYFTDNQKIETIRRRLKYEKYLLDEKQKTETKSKKQYEEKKNEIVIYEKMLTDYQEKVITKRNKFAHCKISSDNPKSIKLKRNETIDVNDEFCSDFRKLLKNQESDLKKLSKYITEKLEELS